MTVRTRIENPILPGFHPDPSICRVGEDYYIACSSFSFFPGLPLFHSRDLCNWEQIGCVLDRPEMVRLNPDRLSYGIWAPTLRWHEGIFYLIVGNWSTGEVLLLTANDPAGPWREKPVSGVGGDPSLFFDDDGRVYCSFSDHGIYQVEIDVGTGRAVGERVHLWNGAAVNAHAPEASHVYKKDGWYYLLISEGGTEHYHAVCVARSRSVMGPYESFRANPILTHRHLGVSCPVCNVGHADIVETPAGEWYMCVLASRPYGGYHKNLGRETFLCPMYWECGWPMAAPSGRVERTYPAPKGVVLQGYPEPPSREDFDGPGLPCFFNGIGTAAESPWRLADGKLYLRALPEGIAKRDSEIVPLTKETKRFLVPRALGFVGRRQEHMCFSASTRLRLPFSTGRETAGLVVLQNAYNGLRCELGRGENGCVLRAVRYVNPHPIVNCLPELDFGAAFGEDVLAELPWPENAAVVALRAEGQSFGFLAGPSEDRLAPVVRDVDGSFMGSETAGGFIGAYVGMFASGNGTESSAEAEFDWFEYAGR